MVPVLTFRPCPSDFDVSDTVSLDHPAAKWHDMSVHGMQMRAAIFSPRAFFLLFLYALTGVLTILGALRIQNQTVIAPPTTTGGFGEAVFFVLLAVGMFFLFIRFLRSRLALESIFSLALFIGTWWLGLSFFPAIPAFFCALLITLLPFFIRRVAFHDLRIMTGAAGVALSIAWTFNPAGLLTIFFGMAIYDLAVVRPKGALTVFVRELLKLRFIPGIMVPLKARGFGLRMDEALKDHSFILGIGDLALPLALVAQTAGIGVWRSCLVLLGALLGLVFLLIRPSAEPRPALPSLALGSGLVYLSLMAANHLL